MKQKSRLSRIRKALQGQCNEKEISIWVDYVLAVTDGNKIRFSKEMKGLGELIEKSKRQTEETGAGTATGGRCGNPSH